MTLAMPHLVLERRDSANGGHRTPPYHPRGEGGGPGPGLYWLDATSAVRVAEGNSSKHAAITAVMRNPQAFGLTHEDIDGWLLKHGEATVSAYRGFLDRGSAPAGLLWKPGQIVFAAMLRAGWAWVSYVPS